MLLFDVVAASGGSAAPVGHPAGEKTFCLSPPKMALALATLGSILLCAVAVALYTLLRGHSGKREARPGEARPAYLLTAFGRFGLRRWGSRDSRQYPLQKAARLSSFCGLPCLFCPHADPRPKLAEGPAAPDNV